MPSRMRGAMALLTAAMLAGCFTSDGSLYGKAAPLRPFRAGTVVNRDRDGKIGHLALRLEPGNVYRFTMTDPGEDFGEGYLLRFFPLSGAPAGLLVFEAVEVCKPSDKQCKPMTPASPRVYGLARLTPHGAEEIIPKCTKDGPLAKLPGVTAQDYDTCNFSDRATLEKALLAVAKQKPKADTVYTFN